MLDDEELAALIERVDARRVNKPTWMTDPFGSFSRFRRQTDQLAHVTVEGARHLQSMPELVEALGRLDFKPGNEEALVRQREKEAHSRRLSESASKQVDSGFALLHGHLLVGMWGAVEAAIYDALVGWLTNASHSLCLPDNKQVRLPMRQLLVMSATERIEVIAENLWDQPGIDRRGVGRFEHVLACVGVNASAPKETRDALFEVQQVRNIFAHRAGMADKYFVEMCPRFGLDVGELVKVDHQTFHKYDAEINVYMLSLFDRSCDRYESLMGPSTTPANGSNGDG